MAIKKYDTDETHYEQIKCIARNYIISLPVRSGGHWNPVKAGFCKLPEEYKYSTAPLYETGIDNPLASSGRISFSSSRLTKDWWWVKILRQAQYTRQGVKTHQPS